VSREAYEKQWLVLSKCNNFVVIFLASIWADDPIDKALYAGEDTRGALLNCHCCEAVDGVSRTDGGVLSHRHNQELGGRALVLELKARLKLCLPTTLVIARDLGYANSKFSSKSNVILSRCLQGESD
jgi:hypothetical protein